MENKVIRFHENNFKCRGKFEVKAVEAGVTPDIVEKINFFQIECGELISYGLTPTESTWKDSMLIR